MNLCSSESYPDLHAPKRCRNRYRVLRAAATGAFLRLSGERAKRSFWLLESRPARCVSGIYDMEAWENRSLKCLRLAQLRKSEDSEIL